MIRVVIIDDELHSRETTKMILQSASPPTQLIGMANNALDGARLVNKEQPNIIFLDIQMPGMSGIEMLDLIPAYKGEIIFITAHDQYAIEAFKKGALHYLLKPIDIDEVNEALKRVEKMVTSRLKTQEGKWLSLSTQEGWAVVQKQDIIRCESFKNYTTLITERTKHTVSKTMKDVEMILPSDRFYRLHASHIINIEHVIKVLKTDGGNVLLSNNDLIPISKSKKRDFFSWFQERMDEV